MNLAVSAIIIAFITSIVFFFIQNAKNKILPVKKTIMYVLLFSILLSLLGGIVYFKDFYNQMPAIFLIQFLSCALGFWVSWFWNKNLMSSITDIQKTDWQGVLFMLVVYFFGSIGFTFVFYYFNNHLIIDYYVFALLPFLLPFFLHTTFKAYIAIPTEIHKLWYYPVYSNGVDTTNVDPDKAIMLEFEYTTAPDSEVFNTKINAPVDMKFGDWFQAYIDYHNDKYTNNQISFVLEDGTPQPWSFFEKPSIMGTPRHIDPDLSITENKLSEKKVIIAQRINN